MTRECVGVMPIAHSGHEFIGNISPTQQLSDRKRTDILYGELSIRIILVLLLVSSLYPFVTTTTKTVEQGVSGTELRPVIDYFDAAGNKDLYHPMVRSSKIKTSFLPDPGLPGTVDDDRHVVLRCRCYRGCFIVMAIESRLQCNNTKSQSKVLRAWVRMVFHFILFLKGFVFIPFFG